MPRPKVVILVDNKRRDLDGAALIAHHLDRLGLDCHLEPLEAFRAVLSARRPDMIIFNLITAGHLVKWTQRLRDMGVLVGVLLNEGLFYDDATMRFNIGRFHRDAHVDCYFCWNETYRNALISEGMASGEQAKVVGVHRFDFYFSPWSDVIRVASQTRPERPKVLVCTDFFGAGLYSLPPEFADRLFSMWAKYVPIFRNYRESVASNWRARNAFLVHMDALLDANKYCVTLRPHPMEDRHFYENWIASLPANKREWLRYEPNTPISSLILDTDIEISCETCTTAIESWIAGKPTIELVFERDPLWFHEEHAQANVLCDDPSKLVGLVDQGLKGPLQPALAEMRQRHISKWCDGSDGEVCKRIAQWISDAVAVKRPVDWSQLNFNDYRRAMKLNLYGSMNQAYHFDLALPFKRLVFGKMYALRHSTYEKSIRPSDVRRARERLKRISSSAIAISDSRDTAAG